jgi:CheY-like chemotaxis protein
MALKILTVDDSKTIRMIVKKAFKPFDCQLFEAENGVEGLALAAKERPDLIVLDITMPVMNGIEMLGKLKSEGELKNIPVIMLTAESGKDNVLQIVKMGVKDYIVKPFKGEQLIERASGIVDLQEKGAEVQGDDKISRMFAVDADVQKLAVPDKIGRAVIVEIDGYLQNRLKEMQGVGVNKFILDLSKVSEINVSLIKLIISIIQRCQASGIPIRLVGADSLGNELKQLQETGDLTIYPSIEEAKASF